MAEAIILEAQDVSVRFGGVVAVNGVDFYLRRGELRCLIGPNGAGKSTFFKCLTGVENPSSGEIHLFGERIDGMSPHAIAALGVGVKTQTPSMMGALTVREHIWLAASRTVERQRANARCTHYLRRFALQEIADKTANSLAHGQRQFVELAMVAAAEPALLLLDEPAAGMSEDETRLLAVIVREMRETASIIIVEHDMAFVRAVADDVVVFHQGGILAEGSATEVLNDARVLEVYLGKGA